MFFGKANIGKIIFVELFPLVSFFFFFWRENCVRSWAFTAFVAFSLLARKLNRSNLLWRMKWGTERKPSITKGPENSLRASVYILCQKCLFADSIFTTNISHNASIWGTLTYLRHIMRQKLQTRPLTPSSSAAMWWPIIGIKTFLFRWKNDGYAKESKSKPRKIESFTDIIDERNALK